MVQPIPEGCHSVIPHLVVRNANEAIDFYVRAFGAKELGRWPSPDGKHVLHASIQIGDSMVMLCDELPQMKRWLAPQSLGGTSVALQLWSEDADAAFRRAVKAGAKVSLPLAPSLPAGCESSRRLVAESPEPRGRMRRAERKLKTLFRVTVNNQPRKVPCLRSRQARSSGTYASANSRKTMTL